MKHLAFSILLSFVILSPIFSAEPERDRGLSLHMLPDRVAKLSGESGGFTLSKVAGKQPSKDRTLKTAKDVIDFFKQQTLKVKENGIWVVYTNPESYSPTELEQLELLKAASKKDAFIIFTCRASELPNGWKRSEK